MAKFDFRERYTIANLEEFLTVYQEKKKLNLGCNIDIRKGYLNVDILDELDDIDLLCDIRALSFIPKESAEEILAYDVLEHLPFSEAHVTLKDWIRILKPEGKIVVRVPDLRLIAAQLLNSSLPSFEAQRLIYGGQDYSTNFHMAGFTSDFLEGMLIGAGCSRIIQRISGDKETPMSHNLTLIAVK
jgi:predicted SAM-dependent methyltransferase